MAKIKLQEEIGFKEFEELVDEIVETDPVQTDDEPDTDAEIVLVEDAEDEVDDTDEEGEPKKETKTLYVTNKELLSEINKSKMSFCEIIDPKYFQYDIIVNTPEEVTPEIIDEARIRRAKRLTTEEKIRLKASGAKPLVVKETLITPESLPLEDLTFRVMKLDHIPLDPTRKRKGKGPHANHVKTQFLPFMHMAYINGVLTEVARSHWKGDFVTGEFSLYRGQITDNLARMFMLLVDRYGRRSNWRSYCVDDQTEALTQRGWLGMNEINEADTILSYTEGNLKWSAIHDIHRSEYDGNMFKMTMRGMDSFVTPGHKFVTTAGLVKAEYLKSSDRLVMLGDSLADDVEPQYSDSFVSLLGWILTEGTYEWRHDGGHRGVSLCQLEGPKADKIREAMTDLGLTWREVSSQTMADNEIVDFRIHKSPIRDSIFAAIPDKNLSMKLILSLSNKQKELLVDTMISGDGWRRGNNGNNRSYTQKDKTHIDLFQLLLVLTGHRSTIKRKDNHISFGKETFFHYLNVYSKKFNKAKVETIDFHGGHVSNVGFYGKTKEHYPNVPTIPFKGMVWCPKTEYGCFVARRNGTTYLTGNTYLDEMKGHALLQLSQIGLQFNEAVGDNPFAFYTTSAKNCLAGETKILTKEFGEIEIEKVVGTDVTLLDGNGEWTVCHIYDHGEQTTVATTFTKEGKTVTVRSTMNHGWMADGVAIETMALGTKVSGNNNSINVDNLVEGGVDGYWVVDPSTGVTDPKTEQVYCPVVPTTGSFALASGIHSRNCFTRMLNLEKKNQNIRDDILIMCGSTPSFTRQNDEEHARVMKKELARMGIKPTEDVVDSEDVTDDVTVTDELEEQTPVEIPKKKASVSMYDDIIVQGN